jgi:hypothetical protein
LFMGVPALTPRPALRNSGTRWANSYRASGPAVSKTFPVSMLPVTFFVHGRSSPQKSSAQDAIRESICAGLRRGMPRLYAISYVIRKVTASQDDKRGKRDMQKFEIEDYPTLDTKAGII